MHPRILLRVEGLVIGALAVVFYARGPGSWLLFLMLILAPDLGALGYAAGPRVGAAAYNTVHTYAFPLLLAAWAAGAGQGAWLSVALIWLAHIGIDRFLGFGLKYPTRFRDNHLTRV